MPEGKCNKCGNAYAGWALLNPEHQTCKCGGKIELIKSKEHMYV